MRNASTTEENLSKRHLTKLLQALTKSWRVSGEIAFKVITVCYATKFKTLSNATLNAGYWHTAVPERIIPSAITQN